MMRRGLKDGRWQLCLSVSISALTDYPLVHPWRMSEGTLPYSICQLSCLSYGRSKLGTQRSRCRSEIALCFPFPQAEGTSILHGHICSVDVNQMGILSSTYMIQSYAMTRQHMMHVSIMLIYSSKGCLGFCRIPNTNIPADRHTLLQRQQISISCGSCSIARICSVVSAMSVSSWSSL